MAEADALEDWLARAVPPSSGAQQFLWLMSLVPGAEVPVSMGSMAPSMTELVSIGLVELRSGRDAYGYPQRWARITSAGFVFLEARRA